MKHLEKKIKRLLTVAILLTVSNINPIFAQNDAKLVYYGSDSIGHKFDPMDSVEVSLLTCSPHEEIYSLYGHAALRWHSGDQDLVFNWGMFSFSKPYFALRFVFGLTDYELAAYPFDRFWPYYQQWGSSITEQVLNLTNDEKRKLQMALAENLQDENRVYRYNFFYNNCSTKPRDMVEGCINGEVVYNPREDFEPTFREMVRECNRYHWWSKFGNDMLLGVKSDLPTTREEQEFLPENLLYDFDRAKIYANGEYRPLIRERRMAVPPGVQVIEPDFPLSPMAVFLLLLGISLVIFALEWKRHKTFKYWDALLMLVQGLAGCVLFVMLFSQHPTTTLNLNYLLFNPLPLFFIPSVIRRKKGWWKVQMTLLARFAIGAFFQSYAEGMGFLALSLLIRILINAK